MAEKQIHIPESEYELTAVRSSGPGGQHVNKASTAIVLKFDITASSLPERVRKRLMSMKDARITDDGVVVIRSETHRSQLRNKTEAIERLHELVRKAAKPPKKRVPTVRTRESKEKRLQEKARRAEVKTQRRKPDQK